MAFKNQVNIQQPAMQPSRDQITADFVASGQPIEQPGPNPLAEIAGGVSKAGMGILKGIGDFINTQKETPEGRYLLTNMLAGITVGLGADPQVGANLVQAGQRQYAIGLKEQQQAVAKQEEEEKETKKEITKLEDDYRKEYNAKKIVKDTKEIDSAISRIDNVWNNYQSNPNPKSKNALDQALVITFNKMLDPGSVVRESEFARTSQGQSLISKMQGASEKLAEGGVGLTDAERNEIIVVAKQLQEGQMIELEKEKQLYRELAEQRGLNIENILGKNKTKVPIIPKGIKRITNNKTSPVIKLESGYSMEILPDA